MARKFVERHHDEEHRVFVHYDHLGSGGYKPRDQAGIAAASGVRALEVVVATVFRVR